MIVGKALPLSFFFDNSRRHQQLSSPGSGLELIFLILYSMYDIHSTSFFFLLLIPWWCQALAEGHQLGDEGNLDAMTKSPVSSPQVPVAEAILKRVLTDRLYAHLLYGPIASIGDVDAGLVVRTFLSTGASSSHRTLATRRMKKRVSACFSLSSTQHLSMESLLKLRLLRCGKKLGVISLPQLHPSNYRTHGRFSRLSYPSIQLFLRISVWRWSMSLLTY